MDLSTQELDTDLASREANHRFLDTLATLRSLLRTDFGSFANPSVREAVTVFSSRIQAFASVHCALDDEAGEPLVDASAYLGRLCADLCAAHLAPRGVYCEFRSDPGRLPRDVCQKLSLIITELVADAAKHAFTDRSWGRVCVSFRRAERGWICQVADNGSGLRGKNKGAGATMVQSLAHALGGELRVHSDQAGMIVSLSLPQEPTPGQALHA
jgi:two-component sensor histidine kinase